MSPPGGKREKKPRKERRRSRQWRASVVVFAMSLALPPSSPWNLFRRCHPTLTREGDRAERERELVREPPREGGRRRVPLLTPPPSTIPAVSRRSRRREGARLAFRSAIRSAVGVINRGRKRENRRRAAGLAVIMLALLLHHRSSMPPLLPPGTPLSLLLLESSSCYCLRWLLGLPPSRFGDCRCFGSAVPSSFEWLWLLRKWVGAEVLTAVDSGQYERSQLASLGCDFNVSRLFLFRIWKTKLQESYVYFLFIWSFCITVAIIFPSPLSL